MDLLIKNGTVVTSEEVFRGDIAVGGGKIALIGQSLDLPAATVVDAAGKYVLPGAIDAHTHLQMPFGGTVSADSYLSGTRAAACGGVTTVFDYPMQRKGMGILETVEKRRALCDPVASVDYAFHCIVTDLNGGSLLSEFEAAVEYGITSFKCFMVYKKEGMMVDDGTFIEVLLRAKEVGAITNIHAENPDVIDRNIERFLREGQDQRLVSLPVPARVCRGRGGQAGRSLGKIRGRAALHRAHGRQGRPGSRHRGQAGGGEGFRGDLPAVP